MYQAKISINKSKNRREVIEKKQENTMYRELFKGLAQNRRL